MLSAGQLQSLWALIDETRVPIFVADGGGYCLHLNGTAEALLCLSAEELVGEPCTHIAAEDPLLVEREVRRLRDDRFWSGSYRVRGGREDTIPVFSIAVARSDGDGSIMEIHLWYPAKNRSPQYGEVGGLTTQDLCLLQLLTEGFSDDQLALLLGYDEASIREMVSSSVYAMNAESRTEACIKAIKAGLIA